MTKKRRRHSDEFKAKVALEAVRGVKTLSELSAAYGVHPTVIAQWKRQLLDGASGVFSGGNGAHGKSADEISALLHEEIGRLKMELDWLKKKALDVPRKVKQTWIDPSHKELLPLGSSLEL
jgi:putative transposase